MSDQTQYYVYYNDNAFVEIAKSLHQALLDLNVPNVLIDYLNPNKFRSQDIYIIMGLNKSTSQALPEHYIAYQLEQTGNEQSWFTESYLRKLNQAMEIWDYSLRNIQNCKSYNLAPKHLYVPLGYMPNLEKKAPENPKKKYDVLFYGSSNKRRDSLIEQLRRAGLRVYYGQYNVWGNERDKLVQQSRIVLNVHYYEEPVLETSRLTYLLANRAFVISEPSQDKLLDHDYRDLVKFVSYPQIVEQCKYYIEHETERTTFAQWSYETFKEKMEYGKFVGKRLPLVISNNDRPNHNILQIPEPETKTKANAKAKAKAKTLSEYQQQKQKLQPKFKKAETEILDEGLVLKLRDAPGLAELEADPPMVSLVTPTANRTWALGLGIRNFYGFNYPSEKLEWIILDHNPSEQVHLPPDDRIKYVLLEDEEDLSLWEKRNRLAKLASGNIIIHMDDDDYYFPNSIWAKVKMLHRYFRVKNQSKTSRLRSWSQVSGCVGCTELGVYHMLDNYSYLVQTKYISEASMAYTKKFWRTQTFNGDDHPELGEGYSFLHGREKQVIDFPYMFNFIANTHNQNVTGKLRTYRDNQTQESYDNFFNLWDTDTQVFFLELKRKLSPPK